MLRELVTRSRKLLIAALGISLLTALALVGILIDNSNLTAVVLTLLIGGATLLIAETALTARRIERRVHRVGKQIAQRSTSAPDVVAERAPSVEQADLIGTVRLLQAQYVGRLDHAQATLEEAVARLPTDPRKD